MSKGRGPGGLEPAGSKTPAGVSSGKLSELILSPNTEAPLGQSPSSHSYRPIGLAKSSSILSTSPTTAEHKLSARPGPPSSHRQAPEQARSSVVLQRAALPQKAQVWGPLLQKARKPLGKVSSYLAPGSPGSLRGTLNMWRKSPGTPRHRRSRTAWPPFCLAHRLAVSRLWVSGSAMSQGCSQAKLSPAILLPQPLVLSQLGCGLGNVSTTRLVKHLTTPRALLPYTP